MKGVSEIIAIILILMIVIALAALAYTWFSGVFASMTGTASTAVTTTTNAMSYQFSIDTAKNVSTGINVVVRNIGAQTITAGTISAYINDAPCTSAATPAVAPGTSSGIITFTCPISVLCTSCQSSVCYIGTTIDTIKITTATGLSQTATVTC